MGRVYTERMFEKDGRLLDYLKENFNIEYDGSKTEFKDAVIEDIMVNINVKEMDNFISLKIDKLVSLKAFLLSKEQGMDINILVQKIDRIMNMSEKGLSRDRSGILLDGELYRFFEIAGMLIDDSFIRDNKRAVEISLIENRIDFNSIKETSL